MTRLIAVTLLAWLGLALSAAEADSQSPMYDAATLNLWEPIFREDVLYNFRKLVLPKLWETASDEEKSRLRRVKVRFPDHARDAYRPLDFYASEDTIYMPVESLRFLGDITLATAWLWSKGYSTSTVFQYLGMLKYQSGTRFYGVPNPRPLETLGIPENARDDPRTRERLSTMFSTAVMFILCHELAHVYYRHPTYDRVSAEQAQRNEAEADALAVELMRRIGDPPGGAALLFKAMSRLDRHRYDFSSEAEWTRHLQRTSTHPMTGERMLSLSDQIERNAQDFGRNAENPPMVQAAANSLARDIRTIGEVLNDQKIHQVIRSEALATRPSMLAPRRSDFFEVSTQGRESAGRAFDGAYVGTITSSANPDGVDMKLVLNRSGDQVAGEYSYAAAYGTLKGYITKGELRFRWEEAGYFGKGKLRQRSERAGSTLAGTWGDEGAEAGGGRMILRRP